MLIVLSGLPGVGKTAISRDLARAIGAVHLRIDSIEQDVVARDYRPWSRARLVIDTARADIGESVRLLIESF